MSFIAKTSGGGDFKPVPPGVYIGRCYSLIDLGTHLIGSEKFGKRMQHRIRIGWELFGEDDEGKALTVTINGAEMPMTINRDYTVSLHEKADLRKHLAAWRGKDFTVEEAKAFDVKKLLNNYCMVNVSHVESGGKTYANVVGLTPLPSALKTSKPAAVHEAVVFDLDEPDEKVFTGFSEYLQTLIKKSPEWESRQRNSDSFDDQPFEDTEPF